MSKQTFDVLNSKRLKEVVGYLTEHYGFTGTFDYSLILSAKLKLYAVTRSVFELPVETLRVNSFGVYIGEWRDGKLRVSIEGSQFFGPSCSLNIIDIDKEQLKKWMLGEVLDRTSSMEGSGYVMVRYGEDYVGGGNLKEDKLLNYVPKNRRVRLE